MTKGVNALDTADRIFELVDKRYQEQRDFAADLGVGPTMVSAWRNKKSESYVKRLTQIAHLLNTTVEYLLTGEKKEPTSQETGELANAIIMGRDGKAVKRTYTKEQMEALRKVIDVMPYLDDEEL